MTLTVVWFGAVGVVALLVGRRVRRLLVPLLAAWFVTVAAVGGYLFVASTFDRTVDEDVVAATAPAATGSFVAGAHPTSGAANLVDQAGGGRVLTLTGFETDPGPDLRVLLVPDPSGASVDDAVDLGPLKGNRGDQQYAVPAGAPDGAVVVWCRAFSVAFGAAPLT